MMSFIEWCSSNDLLKSFKKGKKNGQSSGQGSTEIRNYDYEGQVNRNDSKIYTTIIHDFTKSN